jgi:hypothetical protein
VTVQQVVVMLSPWTRHHATCARVTSAGDCDCGLQAALLHLRSRLLTEHARSVKDSRPLDAIGSVGCKVTIQR